VRTQQYGWHFHLTSPKFLDLSCQTAQATHESTDTTLLGIPVFGEETCFEAPGSVDVIWLPVVLKVAVVMEDL